MKRTKADPCTPSIPFSQYFVGGKEIHLLHRYITRRISAFRKKNRGDFPYSEDPILQRYRFTNIFREYDRVSRTIIESLRHNKEADPDVVFSNIVKWRMLNTELAAERFDETFEEEPWMLDKSLDKNAFTKAFQTVGMKHCHARMCPGSLSGVHAVYTIVKRHVLEPKMYTKLIRPLKDPAKMIKVMRNIPGIADFLAYQIWVDCTYVRAFTKNKSFDFPFSENAFTVAGPGCCRGLRLVFPGAAHSKKGIPEAEQRLFWLAEHFPRLCEEAGLSWKEEKLFFERAEGDKHINVMAWENIMCEFQKYHRLLYGGGGRARPYTPTQGGTDNE